MVSAKHFFKLLLLQLFQQVLDDEAVQKLLKNIDMPESIGDGTSAEP